MTQSITTNLAELPKEQWRPFLDDVTSEFEGWDVTIEVVDRTWGDQVEAERVPFAYINYDNKDDVVIVGVGGRDGRYPVELRHMINHPQHIYADVLVGDAPVAIAVVDANGTETIVTLHPRPALPPNSTVSS